MRYSTQNRNPFINRPFNHQMPPVYPPFHQNYPSHFQQGHPLKDLAVKGVNGLTKTLDHVQSFANMLESAGPIIEKYKPVVKNLPMMLQMLKAMQSTESTEQTKKSLPAKDPVDQQPTEQHGISKPKLYIE